jgi:hypothetical protein
MYSPGSTTKFIEFSTNEKVYLIQKTKRINLMVLLIEYS